MRKAGKKKMSSLEAIHCLYVRTAHRTAAVDTVWESCASNTLLLKLHVAHLQVYAACRRCFCY